MTFIIWQVIPLKKKNLLLSSWIFHYFQKQPQFVVKLCMFIAPFLRILASFIFTISFLTFLYSILSMNSLLFVKMCPWEYNLNRQFCYLSSPTPNSTCPLFLNHWNTHPGEILLCISECGPLITDSLFISFTVIFFQRSLLSAN